MKKFSFTIALLLSLVIFISIPVSAEGLFDSGEACYVSSGAESISYNDKVFVPHDLGNGFVDGDGEYIDAEFESQQDKNKYSCFDVYAYEDCDYVLEVYVQIGNGAYKGQYYVEDIKIPEVEAFIKSGASENYATYNFGDDYIIPSASITAWKKEENIKKLKGNQLLQYEYYPLDAVSEDGALVVQRGMIFCEQSGDEELLKTYYLLDYSEYDKSCFYGDGTFDMSAAIDVTLYELTDMELARELDECYAEDFFGYDDMDWFLNSGIADAISIIVYSLIFGLLPLAAVVLCVVFLLKRVSAPYRTLLYIIGAFGIATLICFAAALLLIL